LIRLFQPQIEDSLRAEEENPLNPLRARAVLESALSAQLRTLADGLLADMILRGMQVEGTWLQHFLSDFPTGRPDASSLAERAKRFATDVAQRRIRPIEPSQLASLAICIFGGHVRLWEDCRINSQLRRLGSAFRLALVGGNGLTVNALRNLLGRDGGLSVDARFIFGPTECVGSWLLGPVFNFISELSVSPYLDIEGPCFNFENRIVVRQPILRLRFGEVSRLQLASYHLHEMAHVTGFRAPHFGSYAEMAWEEDTAYDICRFAEEPRHFDEIEQEFFLNFCNMVPLDANKTLGYERFPPMPKNLGDLVGTLCEKGWARRLDDGRIETMLWKEGRRWWP
jgi:hypothetical protein